MRREFFKIMADLEQERLLIEEVKKQPASFYKLYQLYFDKIYHFLLSRSGQVELAEDITSQTFLNAMEKIHQFKWRNVSFGAWLYRIAINNLNSHFRKHKRVILSEDENLIKLINHQQPATEPYTELDEQTRLKKLYQALKKLPDFEQNLITLQYFQHKSYKEIAEILNISVSTVGVKLHRCIKKIRKIIDNLNS